MATGALWQWPPLLAETDTLQATLGATHESALLLATLDGKSQQLSSTRIVSLQLAHISIHLFLLYPQTYSIIRPSFGNLSLTPTFTVYTSPTRLANRSYISFHIPFIYPQTARLLAPSSSLCLILHLCQPLPSHHTHISC